MEKVDEDANLEFKWLTKRGVGGKNKEVQFYESFIYDGVEYTLYNCVYMYKEGLQEPYIGKLTKIWENPDKSKKVKVHWFFRPEEISNWLGETKTLENEILFASGEGRGLANINPLESIAGLCNVICISKDTRNPQPSDDELKAADFIFYRTFDVKTCIVSDQIDDKIGGLEIKYLFNPKKDESITPISSEQQPQSLLTKTLPNKIKDDTKGESLLEKNTNPTASDKSNHKKPPDEKREITGMPSKNSKVENSIKLPDDGKLKNEDKLRVDPCTNLEISKTDKVVNKQKNKTPTGSDDRPLKKIKTNETQVEVQDLSSKKSMVVSKSKAADVSNLKASGKTGEKLKSDRKNDKIPMKVIGDLEGKIIKKTNDDSAFKVLENKKVSINTNGVANSEISKLKSKSVAVDSVTTDQSGENKKKLSVSKSFKASVDGDKITGYKEFVCGPKPNTDKSGWFRQLPWEERLKNAYDQGTAILLHNVDPDYSSGEVEDIIWHAFNEICEGKIVQRTAVSSPHYGQALILLKTKEAAHKILTKLGQECLMLSNKRPLVATPCPRISTKKNSNFFGHLAIDKARFQSYREDEAVSTSHFSQPNTIEYDMAMEWCLLQSKSKTCWNKFHKVQETELKKLEADLRKQK